MGRTRARYDAVALYSIIHLDGDDRRRAFQYPSRRCYALPRRAG
jgi:hypothetical protein